MCNSIYSRAMHSELHKIVLMLRNILNGSTNTSWESLPSTLKNIEGMELLYHELVALRDLSSSLARGRLQHTCTVHGYILEELKKFQRHLYQIALNAQRIAGGSLSQKFDFLDDFPSAFNGMLQQIQDALTELQVTSEHYKNMARVDTLTGALNRRGFEEEVLREMERTKRARSSFAIISTDLDYFKRINDTYGHPAGDAVLCAFIACLHTTLRETDRVGRMGGEEFSILLPEATAESVGQIAERIRSAIEQLTIQYGGHVIHLTASFGIVRVSWKDVLEADCRNIYFKKLIYNSDKALYHSKMNGRNRVTEYSVSQSE